MSASWQLPSYVRRGDVQLHLSAKGGIPTPPYEFRGVLSEEEYQARMGDIILLLRKVAWSLGERVFLLFAFAVTVVAPIVVFEILSKKLVREAQDKNALQTDRVFVRAEEAALFEARGKALAVLVGTGLVLWLPYFLLKRLGYRRLAALLTRFTDADAGRGPQHTLKWSLLTTSAFSRTAVVNVTLPSSPPTNFHPQAYLPPYMGRADSDSFTQFAPPPGAPPRSVPVNANDGEWEDEKRQ